MFLLLTIFGLLFIAPFALLGAVLMTVTFVLKTIFRLVTMPLLFLGFTIKAFVFLILAVVAAALILPFLLTGGLVIGAGLLAVWAVLKLLTTLAGKGSAAMVKL